jgi:hypothetical protein
MKRALLSVAITALVSCAPAPAGSAGAPTSTPGPGAATATPSPSGASTPSATLSAPSTGAGVTVRARRVPPEHRYIGGAEETQGRIWLVDIEGGTSIDVVAARGEPTERYFTPPFSESGDGRRLLVAAAGPNARAALFVVDVEAGVSRLVYEDSEVQCIGCLRGVISVDGSRYAFGDLNGVRVALTSGGAPTQLVPHVNKDMVGGSWQPLRWSPDGRLLALWRGSEGGSEIALADIATGALTTVGPGSGLAWREKTPRLLVTDGVHAFGGHSEMYTFEPSTGERRQLEPIGTKLFAGPSWHPTEDRILFLSADGPYAEGDAYVRSLAAPAASSLGAPRKVWEAWWSRDGSRMYGMAPRQDAIGGAPGVANLEILELPSGRVSATVCRQDPRARCP